jgi:hypothetical protein
MLRRSAQNRQLVSSEYARSVQLHASHREHHFPEVRLAAVAQGAAYGRQDLDRQMDKSGI